MVSSQPAPRSWLRRCALILWMALAPLALLEFVLRVATETTDGVRVLFGTDLVPLPLPTTRQIEGLQRSVETLPYLIPDAELGWVVRSLGSDPAGLYRADGRGARIVSEGDLAPGAPEIWIFGDSLAHGDEVAGAESTAGQLQARLGQRARIVNYAVPGYGTDQAVLRAEREFAAHPAPSIAMLTLYSRNLIRAATFARPIHYPRSGIPWMKPRLAFDAAGAPLRLGLPVPAPHEQIAILQGFADSPLRAFDLVYDSALYAPSQTPLRLGTWLDSLRRARAFSEHQDGLIARGGQALPLGPGLARHFRALCEERGSVPVLLLLGDAMDVGSSSETHGTAEPLREALRTAGLPFEDSLQWLREGVAAEEVAPRWFVGGRGGHFNASASERIALRLLPTLERWLGEQPR